ncbi:MAG: type II secretion system protein [bacterium]|nr:type II secretion system protein [bacterium]
MSFPKLKQQKGFTLVELLVVIAIIGLLTTIVLVSTRGTKESAFTARGQQNWSTARLYCASNPGSSTLNGNIVYCDQKYVMWTTTLAGTFQWKTSDTDLPTYANGNCNNLTAEDMASYPACNACAALDYAGFSEGWRLPSQGVIPPGSQYCDAACGRDGSYCAPNRQLWDFGAENCNNWLATGCAASQGSCLPSWDTSAVAYGYWSSTQGCSSNA